MKSGHGNTLRSLRLFLETHPNSLYCRGMTLLRVGSPDRYRVLSEVCLNVLKINPEEFTFPSKGETVLERNGVVGTGRATGRDPTSSSSEESTEAT